MPRVGLDPAAVAAAAAAIADEAGLHNLGMVAVAERLGVKPPSLYKHVASLADLRYRVAVLGATELGDCLREALQGRSEFDALRAAGAAFRSFISAYPGRYAAMVEVHPDGELDELDAALDRALSSFGAVLLGYRLDASDRIHALRMVRSVMHGFASIEGSGGFRLATDVDESFEWMLALLDRGLRTDREVTVRQHGGDRSVGPSRRSPDIR